ncbi:hypothetical protein [Pseudomonas entomophila]|uniref:hypothetical protein n=1 Tax=Pseudomonas entomophila TaxID=312306 RepID=UPI003EB969EB
MDFFAIAGSATIYRLDLEKNLQRELSAAFLRYASEFLDPALVVVPFQRENFKPDETEILEIAPFDIPAHIYDPVQNAVGCQVLPHRGSVVETVNCIYGYDAATQMYVFQVIPASQRIAGGRLNIFQGISTSTFSKSTASGLMIGESCHAVALAGSLKFRSMWWLKQIIDISQHYRAATEADIDSLSQMPTVSVENLDQLKRGSGQWIRTRVAYILDSGILNAYTPTQLLQLANGHNVPLQLVQESGVEKILIPKDTQQLRSVLKFLEEEYYAGPITGLSYETSNKRRR